MKIENKNSDENLQSKEFENLSGGWAFNNGSTAIYLTNNEYHTLVNNARAQNVHVRALAINANTRHFLEAQGLGGLTMKAEITTQPNGRGVNVTAAQAGNFLPNSIVNGSLNIT